MRGQLTARNKAVFYTPTSVYVHNILSVTYALFLYPKGGENMEDNSIIAVIKFVSGEWIKIKCSNYSFSDDLVCFDSNGKRIFIAPRERIICVYEEKHRSIE